MWNYVKVSLAAIERYNLEKPLRDMYRDIASKKKRYNALPFAALLAYLYGRGYMLKEDMKPLQSRYKALSEVLHGRH